MSTIPSVINEIDLLSDICRESFLDFCMEFWECVPGAGEVCWNWHMTVFCTELQKIAERVFANQPREYDLVCNVPFGSSKSTIFSILFQPWTWTRMPMARHLTSSHTENLALDLATKSRSVVQSEKYQACFPEIQLRTDQDTKGYFANTLGGDRHTCTVGGKSPVGFHAHFLGGDDILDPQKALSEIELLTARTFISQMLPTRKVDKQVSVMYLVMQRLRKNDPTDVMLEESRKPGAATVRQVCLPGELWKDSEGNYTIGKVHPEELRSHYTNGLLDPIRLPRRVLAEYRARGEYFYAAQVMQDPMALGGGMFRDVYFSQRVQAAPYEAKRIRYIDRAATADGGCFTAMVLMAYHDGNFYVEHVEKGQWEPDERNKRIKAVALRDRSRYGPKHEPMIYIEREGGSSGRDSWKEIARLLAGFKVYEDTPTGSKDVRAEPWACQLAAGTVYIVDNGESVGAGKPDWDINSYIEEHCLFRPDPGKRLGKWKDQVDASSGAANLLLNMRQAGGLRTITLGKPKKGQLRIIVCDKDELSGLVITDHTCLLVSISEPPLWIAGDNKYMETTLPSHALDRLLDSHQMQIADLDPAEHQATWDSPIPPYNLPINDLMFTQDKAKKLWAFLLKKRDTPVEAYVLQDYGGDIALSLGYALCDALHIPRDRTMYRVGNPEWKADNKDKAPSRHIYDQTRAARGLVVG